MDLQVKWSVEATEDLDAIAEYIARDSEYYARAVVTDVLAAARVAGEFPSIGRISARDRRRQYSGTFRL